MAIIIETCPQCGHDLIDEVICTYPPIPRKRCPNCGWSWEGEKEEVIRVPFNRDFIRTETLSYLDYSHANNFEQSPCKNCSNNPKNGGSGICHCTLGQIQFT